MHPNRSSRRIHSGEFKSQVLAECRQPGASVAAVAIAHGLNPNVVRKWLAGLGLKRMGVGAPAQTVLTPSLQFVPVELADHDRLPAHTPDALPEIRIELERSGLRLKLQCAPSAAPAYAALLRALADAMHVG